MASATDSQVVPSGADRPWVPPSWAARLRREADTRRGAGLERRVEAPRGLDFCSNDYLGLRRDVRVAEAAAQAALEHGSGSGGSRLLRGGSSLHEALEEALARHKSLPSALLLNSGFQANATLIPALAREGDHVFSDALNHASLVEGCRLAKARGAAVHVHRHLDLEDLEACLRAARGRRAAGSLFLIATDAVFSMDGDAADLPALLALAARFDALLLVDEAHATGLLGPHGGGLAEACGVAGRIPLVMGTLGKALGAFGAFVACPGELRDHFVNTARGFIFSTSLPPPVLGAARRSLALAREERWRASAALGHAARIRARLGLPPQPSAIVPVVLGTEARALAVAGALQDRGFDVRAVRPPAVSPGTSRLRITTGAHQSEAAVADLLSALEALL